MARFMVKGDARVRLNVQPEAFGSEFVVNGVNISNHVTGVTVTCRVGEATKVLFEVVGERIEIEGLVQGLGLELPAEAA